MAKLEAILNGESINFGSSVVEVQDYIGRNQVDIYYASLFQTERVIFLGERHTTISDKQELVDNLSLMRNAGLTHLAFEMFSASMQGAIDRYYQSGDNRNEIFSYLQDHWGDKGEGVAEKYMEIVDTAKNLGIKIIAIDIDSDEYQSKNPSETWVKRNRQWAKLIAEKLEDGEAKVLVYHGSGHAGYYPVDDRANNELRKLGHDSLTVKYCGGEMFEKGYVYGFDDKVAKSAVELDLQKNRFAVNVNRSTSRGGDLYIHLPQVEQPKLI